MYGYNNGGYPTNYGNFNPYLNPQYSVANSAPMRSEIIRVNGENGARAFNIAANSSALLLDENAPIVWFVQSDGAGYKSVTPYTITPYQQEPPINAKDLETRVARLEEIVNGKSNTSNAKSKPDKCNAADESGE